MSYWQIKWINETVKDSCNIFQEYTTDVDVCILGIVSSHLERKRRGSGDWLVSMFTFLYLLATMYRKVNSDIREK